jgi:hypothetical protein
MEAGHVSPRHRLMVLDLIIARAALPDDARLGKRDDGFNPACGLPACRLPELGQCLGFGLLIDGLDRQCRELR